MRLTLEWVDHRLEYHNLQQGSAANILDSEEMKNIWTPGLVFINTEDKQVTTIRWKSEIGVKILGNGSQSRAGVADETNIFKGKENTLVWTENYLKAMKCVFNLDMFPFDMQVTHLFVLITMQCSTFSRAAAST